MERIIVVKLPFTCAKCRVVGSTLALSLPATLPEPGTRLPVEVAVACVACGQTVPYGIVEAEVGLP